MGDDLRVTLAVLGIVAGLCLAGLAIYLQYASLPTEHTRPAVAGRSALALVGILLIFLGSRLL